MAALAAGLILSCVGAAQVAPTRWPITILDTAWRLDPQFVGRSEYGTLMRIETGQPTTWSPTWGPLTWGFSASSRTVRWKGDGVMEM